jgi:hypothetical protein
MKTNITHKLMIKTHVSTGLKYLCYTKCKGDKYENYKGSGVLWKKHLKKYGDNIVTTLIYETTDKNDFVEYARKKSIELNIVDSKEWANLKLEEGDGGDTVSNRMWINDGAINKYHFKDQPIPDGWNKGRINCIFNDREKQKELNSRVDVKVRGNKIKAAWDSGKFDKRDHSKCGVKGKDNPACRPEVRKKISDTAKRTSKERSERLKNNPIWQKSPRCQLRKINHDD